MTEEIEYYNPFHTDKFTIVLARRAKNSSFYCTKTTIPSISATPPEIGRPKYSSPELSDVLIFENLECDILLNEDFQSYSEIREWMEDAIQKEQKNSYSYKEDIEIITYSAFNNMSRRFVYYNAFPVSISSIELSSTNDPLEAKSFTATFKYSHYNIE